MSGSVKTSSIYLTDPPERIAEGSAVPGSSGSSTPAPVFGPVSGPPGPFYVSQDEKCKKCK